MHPVPVCTAGGTACGSVGERTGPDQCARRLGVRCLAGDPWRPVAHAGDPPRRVQGVERSGRPGRLLELDADFGSLLDLPDEPEVADNTSIVFAGDNGTMTARTPCPDLDRTAVGAPAVEKSVERRAPNVVRPRSRSTLECLTELALKEHGDGEPAEMSHQLLVTPPEPVVELVRTDHEAGLT
jgi:hypothetical protein